MVIIDFHTHIFPPWIKNNRGKYINSDPCFAMYYSSPHSTIITADELIDQMNENEVDTSVVLNIGWSSHDLCVMTNDYLLEMAERNNRRLIPFCSVQPSVGETAVGELLRCLRAGARGLGEMRPDVQDFSLTDDEVMNVLVKEMVVHKAIFLDLIRRNYYS